MIIKSFRKQLQTLYSRAAYKATGILLPCHCNFAPSQDNESTLRFKIDIAHQLYNKYKADDFKFSEKGITPRMIAEETATFCHQSDHVSLQIDSFGNMIVNPTQMYLSEMKQHLLSTDFASHFPVNIRGIKLDGSSEQKQSILYQFNDISLSSMRIVFNLQKIVRKRVLMKEINQNAITKYIDLSALTLQQIQHLIELNLIDMKSSPVVIKTHIIPELSRIIESRQVKFVNNFDEKTHRYSLSGCLRHQTVNFIKNYSVVEQSCQLHKFGQIFPHIKISQISQMYPQHYHSKIYKILLNSMTFDNQIPINLQDQIESSTLKISSILQKGSYSEDQKILILLDHLGNDQIYLTKNTLALMKNNPWQSQLQKTIDKILIKQ